MSTFFNTKFWKNLFKLTLILTLSIVAIFFVMKILLSIPFIQQNIKNQIITAIDKSGNLSTKMDNIDLHFPKKIALEKILIKNQSGDSALYLNHIFIDIKLLPILKKNLVVNKIEIKEGFGDFEKLFEKQYNSGEEREPEITEEKSSSSNWNLIVNRLMIESCYFKYFDNTPSGFGLILDFGKVDAHLGSIDLDRLIYFEELRVSNSFVTYQELSFVETSVDSTFNFADIKIGQVELENSGFFYVDSLNGINVNIKASELSTDDLLVDITHEKVTIDKGKTKDLKVEVFLESSTTSPEENLDYLDWGQYLYRVEGTQLLINNGNVNVQFIDEPTLSNHFDSNHLNFTELNGTLSDFILDNNILQLTIKDLSGSDKNGLELKQMNTRMRMDGKDFVIDNLQIETPSAQYQAKLRTSLSPTDYSDLSGKTTFLDLKVNASNLNDIDFFYPLVENKIVSPELISSGYSLSLKTSGSTDRLQVDDLNLIAFDSTHLQLTGQIDNLPHGNNNIEFDLENIGVKTGNYDLKKILPELPEAVLRFPDFAELSGSYNLHGGKHEFSADLSSEVGNISVSKVEIVPGDSTSYSLGNIIADLSKLDLLTNTGISNLKLNGHAKVSGSELSNLFADINIKVDSLTYGNHTYRNLNFEANSQRGVLDASLESIDPDAILSVDISGNFQYPEQILSAQIDVDTLDLHALGYAQNKLQINTKTGIDLVFTQNKNLDALCVIERLDFAMEDTIYNMHEAQVQLLSDANKTRFTLNSHYYNLDFEAEDSYSHLARSLAVLPEYYLRQNSSDSIKYEIPAYNIQGKLDYPEEFVNLLFPNLPSFEQLMVRGNGAKNGAFYIDVSLGDLKYKGIQSDSLTLQVSGNQKYLQIINSTDVKFGSIVTGELKIESNVADAKWKTRLQYFDSRNQPYFDVSGSAMADGDSIRFTVDPKILIINYENWQIDPAQLLIWSGNKHNLQQGYLQAQLSFQHEEQAIKLLANEKEIDLDINSFNLQPFTHILNDTLPINGKLQLNLKNNVINKSGKWDIQLSDLAINSIPLEQIRLNGEYNENLFLAKLNMQNQIGKFDLYIEGKEDSYDFQTKFDSLNIGAIYDQFDDEQDDIQISGIINGQLEGNYSDELIANGLVAFNNVNFQYTPYQLYLMLDRDTVQFRNDQILFQDFALYDQNNQPLLVNGNIKSFVDPEFDLRLNSDRFILMNNKDDGIDVSGNLQIATDLVLTGSLSKTNLNGFINTLSGSFIQYKYKSNVVLDDMEKVVSFTNFDADTIKKSFEPESKKRNENINWDVDINIENTEAYILLFETSHDYVRIFTDGQLKLQKGSDNKLLLFGEISSDNGSVFYDAPMISALDLKIDQASATWNGEIENPIINFRGSEVFRVSPGEVLYNWGNSAERVPVTVSAIAENTTPNNFDIHFDVESEDGSLQKHFESLLPDNRESYATNLLIFGTLEGMKGSTGGGIYNGVVSKLNEISRRNIKNADLSFYMDRSVGNTNNLETIDQLGYSFSKGLFNQKIRISVGGDVKLNQSEVYDTEMKTFNPFGNVEIDYIISKKPDISVTATRRDIYKGAIDGQITESSAGLKIKKSFRNIFKKDRNKDE